MAHNKRRSLEVRLREYADSQHVTSGQMRALADEVEQEHGPSQQIEVVRDAAGMLDAIADDLDKILAGEEMKSWIITEEVPDDRNQPQPR